MESPPDRTKDTVAPSTPLASVATTTLAVENGSHVKVKPGTSMGAQPAPRAAARTAAASMLGTSMNPLASEGITAAAPLSSRSVTLVENSLLSVSKGPVDKREVERERERCGFSERVHGGEGEATG